jgi:hypothetical protein
MGGSTRVGGVTTHRLAASAGTGGVLHEEARRNRREDGDLVIALFSSRLGCFGSLLVSALLTALVILVLYR